MNTTEAPGNPRHCPPPPQHPSVAAQSHARRKNLCSSPRNSKSRKSRRADLTTAPKNSADPSPTLRRQDNSLQLPPAMATTPEEIHMKTDREVEAHREKPI
ncbi:hypothetical protein STAS_24409 [Striga asiatica]|uniref:Uncharacterized protein n=1 Tax=Striga asiatica TaxID=4170 RepID=A0A5A7QQI7_STRAF|nr:hypothetical protein STAS_24409 [Striga asiatica]